MMTGNPLETCWAFSKVWNNKFYYKFASCWLFLLIHTAMHGSMNIKFSLRIFDKLNKSLHGVLLWKPSSPYREKHSLCETQMFITAFITAHHFSPFSTRYIQSTPYHLIYSNFHFTLTILQIDYDFRGFFFIKCVVTKTQSFINNREYLEPKKIRLSLSTPWSLVGE
jgi:hypothetical protein